MAERTKSRGEPILSLPPHAVATQAKTFTPVGTATSIVVIMNGMRRSAGMPAANI